MLEFACLLIVPCVFKEEYTLEVTQFLSVGHLKI